MSRGGRPGRYQASYTAASGPADDERARGAVVEALRGLIAPAEPHAQQPHAVRGADDPEAAVEHPSDPPEPALVVLASTGPVATDEGDEANLPASEWGHG